MEKFLAVLFYLFVGFTAFAQVTKLPTYAMKLQYDIDAIRDTLSPNAGGIVIADRPIVKDSIVFHYNSQKQLVREQIWRTGDPRYLADTSRIFIDYVYDTQNRLLSKRYGETNGSPHIDSPLYGNPSVYYLDRIVRIDSVAFDNHNQQLFYRRYDLYDIQDYNSKYMVINEGWENEYAYDNLGRMIRKKNYIWSSNIKSIKNYQGMYDVDFSYRYIGNSNKIQARTYYRYDISPNYYLKDSLFTFDSLNRITGCKQFGSTNEQGPYIQSTFRDSTFYFPNNTGNELLLGIECNGVSYDRNGHFKYRYFGSKSVFKEFCEFKGFELSYVDMGSIFINRTYDSNNNTLKKDSVYRYIEYNKLQSVFDSFRFDSTSYYGFTDITTSVSDPVYSSGSLKVYPNPTTEQITFITTNNLSGTLHIYGIDGLLNISEEITERRTTLDISKLQNGFYIIELNGHREKLIKQ